MKFDGINDELKQKVKELLDSAEDKSEAIFAAADMIATAKNEKLIRELAEQNARAAADEDYRKSLRLHVLSKEEKEFYEKFKDIKQAITANQIDIMPTSIVDRTLDDVKKASDVLSLVEFAPADVKKWIVATHSGTGVWGTEYRAAQAERIPGYPESNRRAGASVCGQIFHSDPCRGDAGRNGKGISAGRRKNRTDRDYEADRDIQGRRYGGR